MAEDLSLTRFYFDRSCALGLKDDAIPSPLPNRF